MSSDFLTPTQELQRASEEIAALRRELQGLSASVQAMNGVLTRMEKRLKVAFPNQSSTSPQTTTVSPERASSAKTSEELSRIFEVLLEATRQGGDTGFLEEFDKIPPADVGLVAYELGIPDAKRLGVKKARDAIRRRVQESLMLTPVSERSGAKGI